MSNDTVLARKWRPRQFSEVIGQEAVVRALSQALNSGRLHHAYLFTGTRGVGKTTLARIFAKALNCRHGLSSDPCTDDIAQAIDEGRFVDLIEIDAASKTKVDDTRELLDNVQYAPSVGRFKIYLIDEVHMLSTHSFNALLKTLEEPPEHVKFLLATTDPHKLPVTILSRCLQFHLRPMMPETLQTHLAKVLTQEAIDFDEDAINLVSQMAEGSVRDSLSLLDQAIILGGGRVGYETTREMLGLASLAQMMTLLLAIAQQDRVSVLTQLQGWTAFGADFDRLQRQLLEQFHELSMMQVFPSLAESAIPEQKELLAQVSSEQMQIWLQVALLAKEDMRLAPSAQMGFEILLMRLLHFRAEAHTHLSKPSIQTPKMPVMPQRSIAPNPAPAQPKTVMPVQPPPTPAVTAPIQSAPIIHTPEPEIDLSVLLGVVPEAQKKTLTPATEEPPRPAVVSTPAPTMADPTPITPTEAIITSSLEEASSFFETTDTDIGQEDDLLSDQIDDQVDDQIDDGLDQVDDQTLDIFAEPETIVEPEATSAPLPTEATAPVSRSMTPLTELTPYPVEEWQAQLKQWRLNPLHLSVAERCVRLHSDDPNKVLLACPPAEAVSLALMREKLAQAINKAQPHLQVSWLLAWQDAWLTLQGHAQAVSEQEHRDAQAQIAANPLFTQACQQLGLTPQWQYLRQRTPVNASQGEQ